MTYGQLEALLNKINKYEKVLDEIREYINKNSIYFATKEKVGKHVKDIAKDLVKLYAARANAVGFAFSKDTLKFLVEDNAFVESDRQETLLNGIVAGFNLELSTAMHLLMPQVEHGIRHMAEECGAVVYKTDKNGVESSLSLESILNLPEVEECFDETFLFNLRLFYTSGYGFGMRNAVCHSMYSDKELQTARSLAVWWFTLHICCIFSSKLNERLLEQTQNK